MLRNYLWIFHNFSKSFLLMVLFVSCTNQNKEQLPVELVWDRAVCKMCRMAVSDNRYAAQIVDTNGRAFFFDDIGCAVLWLNNQKKMANARIWVNDKESSEWIEARQANWIYGDQHTPMGYGFAATKSAVENSLDFQTVTKRILGGDTLVKEHMKKHLGRVDPQKVVLPAKKSGHQKKMNTTSQIKDERE